MTYLAFHLVFILPPIAALALVQQRPLAGVGAPEALKWLGAILLLAFVYTTPWDNFLVANEIWTYPPGRVLATIGYVPVEEYAFFVLQPILTGLFYFALRGRGVADSTAARMPRWFRPALTGAFVLVGALGVGCLAVGGHALYLGLVLAWAAPVLAGLCWVGAEKIWEERSRVGLAIAVPSIYLWIADRYAIGDGIWDITDATRTGAELLGLPVEEAVFFVVTNALCVFGLALFLPSPSQQ